MSKDSRGYVSRLYLSPQASGPGFKNQVVRFPESCEPGERICHVYRTVSGEVRLVIDGPAMPGRETIVFTLDQARALAEELTGMAALADGSYWARADAAARELAEDTAGAPLYDIPGLPEEVQPA